MKNIGTVWEILNAALYDIEEGDPADAIEAIAEAIGLIEEENPDL